MRSVKLWLERLLVAALLIGGLSPLHGTVVPMAAGDERAAIDLSAYALPDGTLPILCLGLTEREGENDVPALAVECCAVCALASVAFAAPPLSAEMPSRSFGPTERLAVRERISSRPNAHPVRQRGPPPVG